MRKKMSPQIIGYLLVLVAQYAVNAAPVGAPETIELFHPEMPPAPARSPANKKEAVPVIHLDMDENGKASVDAYLKMFPQELLTSNKKVKPIDIHKIEYENFIDYEIEFVELPDEIDEDKKENIKLSFSETGEHFNDTIEEMSSSYVNKSVKDEQSSKKSSISSSEIGEESNEMNLETFADLLRRARIKHQSNISSDNQRRRRIKLIRDPISNNPTDTNDSSNQIDTAQDLKREQNSYSKTKTFSKPRKLRRNKSIPEANRNSGNRRITLPRFNSFRVRTRIPIKSGRNFPEVGSPVDQLINRRNPKIIAETETKPRERNMKMTTSTSADNLYTISINEEDPDESIVVTQNVTSTRFVTSASSFPILSTTATSLQGSMEDNLDDKFTGSENIVANKLYLDIATTRKQHFYKPTNMMVHSSSSTSTTPSTTSSTTPSTTTSTLPSSTLSAVTTKVPIYDIQTTTSNDNIKITTITTTKKSIRSTTEASTTSTTLMMYPEFFTEQAESQEVKQEDSNTIETISLPFSLFSLFGGKPKSSRLEIAPPSTSTYRVTKSSSRKEGGETINGMAVNEYKNKKMFSYFTHPKNRFTSTIQLPQVTTVTSSSQFSIISTSTQTSIPHHEPTTTPKSEDEHLIREKNNSIEPYSETIMTDQTNSGDEHRSSTDGSLFIDKEFSTTISPPALIRAIDPDNSDLSRTTRSPNWMQNSPVTEMKNEYTTNTNNMQNEYKEVKTSTKVEPTTDDSRPDSTPNNPTAALPEDFQMSDSITSVYFDNHPTSDTITNNVGTTENPKTEAVNSITLMPYSKLVNHRQEKESTTAQSITENIFIVTPQYMFSTSPNTKKTTSAMQETTTIRENQMGQYEEVHPEQYEELHPGQPGQYHNFEKSYSGYYEVNDVKVDFDHQDEHKIYNVQAKAGDFIIGEVGRIDVNNGQTLEGVRYTALEGEVDPLRILQILEKFFGTQTR